MNKFRSVLLGLFVAAVLAVLFQNCGQDFVVQKSSSSSNASSSASSQEFTVQAAATTQLNLGSAQDATVTVTPQADFAGDVDLALDDSQLKIHDPNSTTAASLPLTHLVLTAGSPLTFTVHFQATASAPTLDTYVNVLVTESHPAPGREAYSTTVRVPVKVVAVYEIKVTSTAGASEIWSSPKMVNFTTHPEGVKIRFINASAVAHRIHSAGPIPHEGADLAPGMTYEYLVTTQSKVSNVYYCHDHESASASSRTLVFNAMAAPVAPTMSGNPNAKYSYLAANVMGKCTGCHSGATPSAGLDLSTYAKVVGSNAAVVAGSASSSGLYLQTANGSMPKGGSALSAADIQNIKDWINDGAANN